MPSQATPPIRRAQRADIDALAPLWHAFLQEQTALDDRIGAATDALARWKNDIPEWLKDDSYRLFVAEEGGTMIGFVAAHRWAPPPIYRADAEVYLTELYVSPNARHRGIGTALVHAVRAWAHAVHAERVRLQVLEANAAGRAFWKQQQATPLSETWTLSPAPDARPSSDSPDADASSASDPSKEERSSAPLGFQWNNDSSAT